MNLVQKLRFFRELADKIKQYDVAGKLDYAADIADQVEQALRYAADLTREYLGTPTVGHDGNGELAEELALTESAAMSCYATSPLNSVGALNPAVIPVLMQLLIEVVRLIRQKHKV